MELKNGIKILVLMRPNVFLFVCFVFVFVCLFFGGFVFVFVLFF